jgi:uncharacterized protein Smg (DUF494 family)
MGYYMQEKIVEIILHLISDIRNQKIVEENVIKKLVDKGYTQSEISAAFSWIYDRIQFGESLLVDGEQKTLSKSYRVFHDAEKLIFTSDARGYLIQCYELSLIDEWDVEFIIDRAMFTGFSKVGIKEAKALVASTLFDFDDSDRVGSRIMLNSKDTVN